MMRTLTLLLLCSTLLLGACKKEPGEGGKSEIRGYLYEQAFNNGTCQPIGNPYPLLDARVSIIYGDNEFYDDDVRSGPDGLFVFPWLRKGDYRLYAVSECRSNCDEGCSGQQKALFVSASVNGKKEVVNVGTITVKNY